MSAGGTPDASCSLVLLAGWPKDWSRVAPTARTRRFVLLTEIASDTGRILHKSRGAAAYGRCAAHFTCKYSSSGVMHVGNSGMSGMSGLKGAPVALREQRAAADPRTLNLDCAEDGTAIRN